MTYVSAFQCEIPSSGSHTNAGSSDAMHAAASLFLELHFTYAAQILTCIKNLPQTH